MIRVLGDIVGYYQSSTVTDLQARLAAAEAKLTAQAASVDSLLTDTNVIPSTCTGTFAAPTAPAGKLCIYPDVTALNLRNVNLAATYGAIRRSWRMKTSSSSSPQRLV